MDAQALREYVWQGLRKEVYADKIEIFIPFYFGSHSDQPLCLTWNRDGILSDGGRTVAELEKRVGSIQPYLDEIYAILSECGDCRLVSGRILVKDQFQTMISGENQYLDYLGGMNQVLRAITRISMVDMLPDKMHRR